MTELVIRSDNEEALQKLAELMRLFEFDVQTVRVSKRRGKKPALPVEYAKKPDFMALAGIWEGTKMTQDQLRKKAWGERL